MNREDGQKRIVIILPAYNEAKTIGPVIDSIREAATIHTNAIYDIVVINDGSTDETESLVQKKNVGIVTHEKNRGLGSTFRTATDYALTHGYDCMVFFDADGQFIAEEIQRMVEPVLSGTAACAVGTRFSNGNPKDMSAMKIFGNRFLARFMTLVTRHPLSDVACGFRAYSREALLHINLRGSFTYTQEVILDLLFKDISIVSVPISVRYFSDRTSTISSNLWKYGWRVFSIIARTIINYRPLAFFGLVGLFLFITGLFLDVWMIIYYIQNGMFSPYKIVGFGGAFLNFLGITVWFIGVVADMLNRIRQNQDEILYRLKRQQYK